MYEEAKLLVDVVTVASTVASTVLTLGGELNVASWDADDGVYVESLLDDDTVAESLDMLIAVLTFVQVAEGSVVS